MIVKIIGCWWIIVLVIKNIKDDVYFVIIIFFVITNLKDIQQYSLAYSYRLQKLQTFPCLASAAGGLVYMSSTPDRGSYVTIAKKQITCAIAKVIIKSMFLVVNLRLWRDKSRSFYIYKSLLLCRSMGITAWYETLRIFRFSCFPPSALRAAHRDSLVKSFLLAAHHVLDRLFRY